MLKLQNTKKNHTLRKYSMWIRKGVINPKDPRENGTRGGTGPLNNDAACSKKKIKPNFRA